MLTLTPDERWTLYKMLWDHVRHEYPTIDTGPYGEDPWKAVKAVDDSNPEERKREAEYRAVLEVLMYLQNINEDKIHDKCVAYRAPFEDMSLYIEGSALDRHVAKWRLAIGK